MTDKLSKKLYEEAKENFARLRNSNKKAMNHFLGFIHNVDENGALSSKMKQLMSVAISLIIQCEWCITYHTFKALELGATKEELEETCFVASFFGGGPAMMHTKYVFEAIEEFHNTSTKGS
ncbi:MAG: carboxymuconolactone decarboxylase family protein [Promethearchaeota archaeon]